MKLYLSLFTYLITLVFFSTTTYAQHYYNNGISEYALLLSSQQTELLFSDQTNITTDIDQLGILWYETFSSYFDAGLEFGYTEMTQLNNTSSVKLSSGEYAGLLLRFTPIEKNLYSLELNINYRFNQSKGEVISQKTAFSWHKITLSPAFLFHALDELSFFAAPVYSITKGRQIDTGELSQTKTFQLKNNSGIRLGLDFKPDKTSKIRLEWSEGTTDGIRLFFSREL
ncbi:MAG: hypothetical protein QM484_06845 [Woeseiaceae bacterium]